MKRYNIVGKRKRIKSPFIAEIFGVCMKLIYTWKTMDKEGKRRVFKFVPRSPHRIDYEKLLA